MNKLLFTAVFTTALVSAGLAFAAQSPGTTGSVGHSTTGAVAPGTTGALAPGIQPNPVIQPNTTLLPSPALQPNSALQPNPALPAAVTNGLWRWSTFVRERTQPRRRPSRR